MIKFDEYQCHKWGLLLRNRKKKIDKVIENLIKEDFKKTEKLFQEVFYGGLERNSDHGMEGSLLYHMAMVSKMQTEYEIILKELGINAPNIEESLKKIYSDFVSDVKILLNEVINLEGISIDITKTPYPNEEGKIQLLLELNKESKRIKEIIRNKDPEILNEIQISF